MKIFHHLKILMLISLIPAIVYHEFMHLLMTFIVRAKCTGYEFNINLSNDVKNCKVDACINTETTNRFKRILIAIAPLFGFIGGMFLSIKFEFQLPIFYFIYGIWVFLPSGHDWANIRSALTRRTNRIIDNTIQKLL